MTRMGLKSLADLEKAHILALKEENVTIKISLHTGSGMTAIKKLLADTQDLLSNQMLTHISQTGRKRKTFLITDRLLVLALKKTHA